MMSPQQPDKVSSFPTFIRTLQNDFYSRQWFSHLLWHPAISSALISDKNRRETYRTLARIERQELGLYVLSLLLLLGMATPFRLPAVLCLLLVLMAHSYLSNKKKALVVQLSAVWLRTEFPPETFDQKTLYQITEILSRKYDTVSLVDTLYFSDSILRILYIGLFVFLLIPYPVLNFFLFAAWVVTGIFLIRYILNNRRIYQNRRLMDMI